MSELEIFPRGSIREELDVDDVPEDEYAHLPESVRREQDLSLTLSFSTDEDARTVAGLLEEQGHEVVWDVDGNWFCEWGKEPPPTLFDAA